MPACGYYLVETFTWTGLTGTPITQDTSGGTNYKLNVESTSPTDHNVYTVKLEITALYATLVIEYTQEISFDITVTDPCRTTEIAAFTLNNMAFEAGASTE